MKCAAIYCAENGQIQRIAFFNHGHARDHCLPGEEAVEAEATVSDDTHYVTAGEVVLRPVFDVAGEISLPTGTAISVSLPVGTTVSIGEQSVVLDDGILELEADVIDQYEIHLALWPFISKTVIVSSGVQVD